MGNVVANENWNVECAICFRRGRIKYSLECNHIFCKTCIQAWCVVNPSCPMCRIPILDANLLPESEAESEPPPLDESHMSIEERAFRMIINMSEDTWNAIWGPPVSQHDMMTTLIESQARDRERIWNATWGPRIEAAVAAEVISQSPHRLNDFMTPRRFGREMRVAQSLIDAVPPPPFVGIYTPGLGRIPNPIRERTIMEHPEREVLMAPTQLDVPRWNPTNRLPPPPHMLADRIREFDAIAANTTSSNMHQRLEEYFWDIVAPLLADIHAIRRERRRSRRRRRLTDI